MEMIDDLFTSQFFTGYRRAFVINTCTIDIKQFCADKMCIRDRCYLNTKGISCSFFDGNGFSSGKSVVALIFYDFKELIYW